MESAPMSFEKFKHIMELLIDFNERRVIVSDFFEKELMKDNWCIFTFGNEIEEALISLLADIFNCWYCLKSEENTLNKFDWWNTEAGKYKNYENDIEYWLYPFNDKEDKSITINGERIDINSLESFYQYLIDNYNGKFSKSNLTTSET